MREFYNTLIESSESLKEAKLDRPLGIPIISEDNAYVMFIKSDDYSERFGISTLYNGLTRHNGQYYWFNHNILKCTKNNYGKVLNSNYSYDIFPIPEDFANRILNRENIGYYEIVFSSFYYYGEYYTSVKSGGYYENYIYRSKLSSGRLTIPYGCSPTDLLSIRHNFAPVSEKIGEYLTRYNRRYPKGIYYVKLSYNMDIIRNDKLDKILY